MPDLKFEVKIDTGNDAAVGGDLPQNARERVMRQTVADALREIADKVQADEGDEGDDRIRDANGNTIGQWFLSCDVED